MTAPEDKDELAEFMKQLQDKKTDALLQYLAYYPNPALRAAAAYWLGSFTRLELIIELYDKTQSERYRERDEIIPVLMQALETDEDLRVQLMAIYSLGELEALEAIPQLKLLAEDKRKVILYTYAPAYSFYKTATLSLLAMETEECRDFVYDWSIRHLKHENPDIRLTAINHLRFLKRASAVPHLIKMLPDKAIPEGQKKSLSRFVVELLEELATEEELKAIRKYRNRR